MSPSKLTFITQGDREVVFTRAFAASRDMVFDCMTKPDLVKRWLLGPPGWTMPVCEIDLRVGGKFRYVWRNQDGRDMAMAGVYREIAAPERIVHNEVFDDDWTGGETTVTSTLSEAGGRTTLTTSVIYANEKARQGPWSAAWSTAWSTATAVSTPCSKPSDTAGGGRSWISASPTPCPPSGRPPPTTTWPIWTGSASSRLGPWACRWPICRRSPSAWAATTTWPPPCGPPDSTKRGCWPAWSTTRPRSRRSRWTPGEPGSTTGRSSTPPASSCSTARPTPSPRSGNGAGLNDAFGRRAAFALLACLALHDKTAGDTPFLDGLTLIERAAGDNRSFVKKAANWALRAIGLRESPALKAAALDTARRLAASPEPSARWIGKDAVRALEKDAAKSGTGTHGKA